MKQRHFIDSHKCSNAAAVLFLIWRYRAFDNETAWVYLALHGTYGFLWAIKSRVFGDKQWDQPVSLGYGLVIWGALSLFWIAPFLITSGDLRAPGWYLALCISLYAFGVFFHFAADMQKHTSLALRPGHLFRNGLWAHCRNPNYFGELLIYAGFGLLAMHWAPLLVLASMVLGVWIPNMLRKDRSLSRYPEFAEWKAHSALFIPHGR
jgi:steroid 5-alpha reductase family enzyme